MTRPTLVSAAPLLRGLTALIVADAAGEALRLGLHVPVPGAVLGMLLLCAWFAAIGGVPEALEITSRGLLSHLSLFFVPAAVGVVGQAALIGRHWAAMAAALLGSSILSLLATAGALHALRRLDALLRRPTARAEDVP